VPFKALPDEHFVVIDDWVLDVVLQHSVPYFIGALLVFELGAMTPNKYNGVLPRELLLQIFDVWQDVQAVDAAICPEID